MVWKFPWLPECSKWAVPQTQQKAFGKPPQKSSSTSNEVQTYVLSASKLLGNNFTASSWGVFPCQDFLHCSLPPCLILIYSCSLRNGGIDKWLAQGCTRSSKQCFEPNSSLGTFMYYSLGFPPSPYLWEWKQTTNPTLLRANYLLCYSVFQLLP